MDTPVPISLRLRSQISDEELESKVGKIVTDDDYNVLLTGPTQLFKPNGKLLAIYLPGALRETLAQHPTVFPIFHHMRGIVTDNRGDASGSKRFRYGEEKRTRTKRVRSIILGSFDPGGPKQFCRMTSWTHKNAPRWNELHPFFVQISRLYEHYVPERFAVQMGFSDRTDPNWLIPGTCFTTITVNNTYPTGVHTDSGDLDEGFSTLACIRRGTYTGGHLVLVRYRVAVDMRDGDLLLFDAHEFHGNTRIETQSEDAERISVVSYYRTGMVQCGTADEELGKAQSYAERRGGVLNHDDGEVS